ncbi:MAG TPA: hypothetical protein VK589_15565 [Chryseolinea sp.]|nr:hypothetical protein [Chryseolinea sp.]
MKYLIVAFASVFAVFTQVYGQEAQEKVSTQQQQVTDEELKKYAVAMDSINDMKETLSEEIGAIVQGEGKMTIARYNELSTFADDTAKLALVKATPEEIALLRKVAEKKNEGIAEINNTFKTLAKDYVGAASYNKIKRALTTDSALKSKYEAMLEELDKDGSR